MTKKSRKDTGGDNTPIGPLVRSHMRRATTLAERAERIRTWHEAAEAAYRRRSRTRWTAATN
jgi:hypothetical protein